MAVTAPCKLKFILFLWACLAVPSVLTTSVKYCDRKADYAVKVERVDISPDPVKAGQPAVFFVSATTGKALSKGSVVINVSYFGLHVHSETIDLCNETTCPLAAGNFVLSHKQTLPSFTPPGTYALKMEIHDSNNNLLTCISFSFKISFGSSVSDI